MERIWYQNSGTNFREALPIGNGKMAAMVYGGTAVETIQVDDSTFWSGEPSDNNNRNDTVDVLWKVRNKLLERDYAEADRIGNDFVGNRNNYGTHMPMANLVLTHTDVKEYRLRSRGLDIHTGMTRTTFEADGSLWTRTCFISNPDKVMVLRYAAEDGSRFSLNVEFNGIENDVCITGLDGQDILLGGHAYESVHSDGKSGVTMAGRIRVCGDGEIGWEEGEKKKIRIKDASEIILYIATETTMFESDPDAVCRSILDRACRKGYDCILEDHCADVAGLMGKMSLQLGKTDRSDIPTDQRIAAYREGQEDSDLIGLTFDYGRYLLIASSREDSPLPTHMGGIWNDNVYNKLCSQDMHIDLNVQMQYWLAGPVGAVSCMKPVAKWLRDVVVPAGEKAAKEEYGARGWVAHVIANPWGFASLGWSYRWGVFPMGGVWTAALLWDYYEYGRDQEFLKNTAYPIIKGAAQFVLDYLFWDEKSGYWMAGPSYSPENWYLEDGKEYCLDLSTTCDILMAREIFEIVLRCAQILDCTEDEMLSDIRGRLEKLPPYKIGKYGQLQEWFYDHEEAIPNHRHVSHLLGIYPFNQIHPQRDPELAEAAAVSMARRLTDHELTSWAGNMLGSVYVKLWKSREAYDILNHTFKTLCMPNLSIIMPPMFGDWPETWELDGNTGFVSAICEMFAQCSWYENGYELYLLPSLPETWADGEIRGLCMRGGCSVDLKWSGGKLTEAAIYAADSIDLTVSYNGFRKKLSLKKGERMTLSPDYFR